MFVPSKLKTVAGMKRCEIRNWWIGHGRPGDVCTIYNDGLHLYVLEQHLIPGSFISAPATLKRLPYAEGIRKIGSIRIIHRGHRLAGINPNIRSGVNVLVECPGLHPLSVGIDSMMILYVIGLGNCITTNHMYAGLPPEVLKW